MSSAFIVCTIHFVMCRINLLMCRIHFSTCISHSCFLNTSCKKMNTSTTNTNSAHFRCGTHCHMCRTHFFKMNPAVKDMNTACKLWVLQLMCAGFTFSCAELVQQTSIPSISLWARLRNYEFCNFFGGYSFLRAQNSYFLPSVLPQQLRLRL